MYFGMNFTISYRERGLALTYNVIKTPHGTFLAMTPAPQIQFRPPMALTTLTLIFRTIQRNCVKCRSFSHVDDAILLQMIKSTTLRYNNFLPFSSGALGIKRGDKPRKSLSCRRRLADENAPGPDRFYTR